MTKLERKRARHARKVSRRTLLKGAGAAAGALTASLFIPRMAHAVLPKPLPHPHWDLLMDHIDRNPVANDGFGDGRLRSWVHGLVLHPARPQRALLLTGPEASGKTMFHNAMGLLLPAGGIVQYPADWAEANGRREREIEIKLKDAWLAVINDVPAVYVRLFEKPRYRNGRFLKWSLAFNQVDRPLPNTIHFDLKPPTIVVPKADFIRRLEDERDAFQQTLRNYA